jgi:cytochrome c
VSSSLLEFTLKPVAFATTLLLATASLPALANLELAQKNACTACHAVDKKVVGPAYQDVVKKYATQKDALPLVSENIRKGGSGKWGPVPMPAQPALSDADVKTLATWVLGGAK